jgi:hypothetical protein
MPARQLRPASLTLPKEKSMEASPGNADWALFARPDFRLSFRYPAVTPQGRSVHRVEEQWADDADRVHLTSVGSPELYIEVCRFSNLTPREEYRRHRPYLEQRGGTSAVSAPRAATLAGIPALAYRFRVGERERAALAIQAGRDAYRIIYDPRSPLNAQVVATMMIAR